MNNQLPTGLSNSLPPSNKAATSPPPITRSNVVDMKVVVPTPPSPLAGTTVTGERFAPGTVLPSVAVEAQVVEGLPPTHSATVTAAEAESFSLTKPQQTAIIRLTNGATRSEAAIAAGVTRVTLYRWLKSDPAFQAAYNTWQRDITTTTQGQLLAAAQDAVACVVNSIRKGNDRLAWKLLESQGLTKQIAPGATDPKDLELQQKIKEKREEITKRKVLADLVSDDMGTLEPFRPPFK